MYITQPSFPFAIQKESFVFIGSGVYWRVVSPEKNYPMHDLFNGAKAAIIYVFGGYFNNFLQEKCFSSSGRR